MFDLDNLKNNPRINHVPFYFQKGYTFIRVFELPEIITNQFCFGGGHAVQFRLVDWFRMSEVFDNNGHYPDSLVEDVKNFIRMKAYFNKDRFYIAICANGECFLINEVQL
jgi:hypothetical protein